MSSEFRHIVITRFNIPFIGNRHLDDTWLERRFELCDAFCFPSLEAQTCSDYSWLIAFHHQTPIRLYSRIAKYADGVEAIPWFMDRFNPGTIRAAIQTRWKTVPEWIITTRLDSDDALSRDHIERVQAAARFGEPEFLNFRWGWMWKDGQVFSREYLSNPFLSFVERTEDFLSAYCTPHPKASAVAPLRQIEDSPGWLRVVHGGNINTQIPAGCHHWVSGDMLKETFGLRIQESLGAGRVDNATTNAATPGKTSPQSSSAVVKAVDPQPLKSLSEIFSEQCKAGFVTDKGTKHSYLPFYELLFARYRDAMITILEIGVGKGYSLSLWNGYFYNAEVIYGLDIKLRPLQRPCPKVRLVEGSAVDEKITAEHFSDVEFDIIIDDASHAREEQLRAFALYYPRLKSGGLYVIEDVQNVKRLSEDLATFKPIVVDLRFQKSRSDDVLFLFFK